MSVSEPGKIITPWAESGLKNPIPPAANPATGLAGFDQGFSAINMTAKEAGGIPPFGQDFNGIFYEVTNILRYMQAGGQPTFDAALATAIGGYPKGAMVLGSDGLTLWQSQIDSNSDNPDTTPANWKDMNIWGTGIPRGNDGVDYAISGCAVRRDTTISPDWAPVSDSAHIPINVTSVVGGVNVRVNYVGQKIGTFVAGPDESFAKDGALVGASVAADFANVSIGAPCSFSVDLATGTFEFDDHYFDAIRFGLSIGAAGNVTITHPGIRTMLHPIIRYVAPSSTSKVLDVHYQNKTTAGVTGLFLVGDVEGTISYNGTNWVLGSCDQWVTSDLTFSWDPAKGELTVQHPVLLGSPELVLTPMYLGTPMAVGGLAAAGNGFKVQFNKVVDGTPPTTPNPGLGFYFSRGKNGIRKAPTGKLLVHLGYVQVNCDQVDYPGGNFWFQATMQN